MGYVYSHFVCTLCKSKSKFQADSNLLYTGFVTEEKASEIEKFFEANLTPAAERIAKQNCEAIRFNAMWLERFQGY